MAALVAGFAALGGCMLTQGQNDGDLLSHYGPVGQDKAQAKVRAASKPVEKATVHTVSAGETLYSISRKYDLSPEVVAGYNDIDAPYLIRPHQKIRIPDAGYALAQGRLHFANGDYGLAEQHFRRAVEFAPNNAKAWVGLAASYDRLRRFKLASRAYRRAIKLAGKTPTIRNNLGYSYMLRGDFARARKELQAAYRESPDNPVIRNNLMLLRSSLANQKKRQRT